MTIDISGFGTRVNLIASNTLPIGYVLTQFAGDSDAIDIPSIQIADGIMGLNGDLTIKSKANATKINLNIIPGGEDDKILSILFRANRVGAGKTSARDRITMTIIYPGLQAFTLVQGFISDGMPGLPIAGDGGFKTKTYGFMFQSDLGVGV